MRHFLLSPARCDGIRAGHLTRPDGASELARRLRTPAGAPIGEVFTFASGLYFRGKLAYATTFATGRVRVITPDGQLWPPERPIVREELARLAGCSVDERDPAYASALTSAAAALPAGEVVLLGSLATAKYLVPLRAALGDRLRCPPDLARLGDMQRGATLLRCVAEDRELAYAIAEVPPARRPARRRG